MKIVLDKEPPCKYNSILEIKEYTNDIRATIINNHYGRMW
jgi:hypothetical protein